ncbi:hypothetical protein ACQP3L_33015, partial [Escherichia coli]
PSWCLDQSCAGLPAISLGSLNSPLFKSAFSVGFSILVLTTFLNTPPSLQLDSSSVQCFIAVSVCCYFHQLLEEGSRISLPGKGI